MSIGEDYNTKKAHSQCIWSYKDVNESSLTKGFCATMINFVATYLYIKAAFFRLIMPDKRNKKGKDIVLYVGLPLLHPNDLRKTPEGKAYRYAIMHNIKNPTPAQQEKIDEYDIELKVRFDKPRKIMDALLPYEDTLLAVTCRSEFNIPFFQRVIPYVPYLRTPTVESLSWATDKIRMRRRFLAYDKSITPDFKVVKDADKKTLNEVESKLDLPVVVKPSGLALSLLVNIAYHHEELKSSLQKVFRKITKANRENKEMDLEPRVLVEQYMEGTMYSVDVFVSSRGHVYFCPMVYVKTGRDIGFDDFFSYLTLTPTNLTKKSVEDAHYTARQAVHALGLRSTSAHIEMLKTEHGWKIIEVGPRLGGFRAPYVQAFVRYRYHIKRYFCTYSEKASYS